MTITLHAQPYDISTVGFFFESHSDYAAKAAALRTAHGDPVEEFEIQFIDGEAVDAALAKAFGINQANLARFFDVIEAWDEDQKTRVIIAVGDNIADFDLHEDDPDDLDIDIYELESLRDLAEQFVADGLFGEIPERLQFYIDLDAIARDLGMDYTETTIAGTRLIYRAA